MKPWYVNLARLAYWLACVSCLCMVWMALTYPIAPPRRLLSHTAEVVWWTLCLYAPLSIVWRHHLSGNVTPTALQTWTVACQAAVVLGIVAWFVIAINTALLQAPKSLSAKDPSCVSNEKQLALGIAMYAQDYDEHYPFASWNAATMPYLKNEAIYRCPEEENEKVPSYGMNLTFVGGTEAQVDNPSETVMLIDCSPGANRLVGKWDYPFTDRHGGRVVLACADNHVKGVNASAALELIWELPQAKRDLNEPKKSEIRSMTQACAVGH